MKRPTMLPYFYSLGMLVTGRAHRDYPALGATDVLAEAIATEGEHTTPPPALQFLFDKNKQAREWEFEA